MLWDGGVLERHEAAGWGYFKNSGQEGPLWGGGIWAENELMKSKICKDLVEDFSKQIKQMQKSWDKNKLGILESHVVEAKWMSKRVIENMGIDVGREHDV